LKQKKLPLRMCVACRKTKPKKELLRVVKNKENEISVDFIGKKPGRGAYLCKDISCLKKAEKGKMLERALNVTIGQEVYEVLKQQLEGNNGQ
jgi:predicted RNA-binding protein YlxR (DUF448 family)